jgi:hypothetical protein
VAALRRRGMRAAQTIDGAMTGKKFLAYVERCLAPICLLRGIAQWLAMAPAPPPKLPTLGGAEELRKFFEKLLGALSAPERL